ncbi:hypothetical protein GCM10023063_26010 [Arthrobacter methylotrophus]|uniref:Uncharacterized protein n=1 Tax=Arthrobacter methylotrophus TaxID=121291 RepID=A0ABV5UJD2_9MICC
MTPSTTESTTAALRPSSTDPVSPDTARNTIPTSTVEDAMPSEKKLPEIVIEVIATVMIPTMEVLMRIARIFAKVANIRCADGRYREDCRYQERERVATDEANYAGLLRHGALLRGRGRIRSTLPLVG